MESHLRYVAARMQGDLDIVDPLVEEYLLRIAGSPDPVEADMRRYADERDGFPIVGPLVGQLLQQLTLLVRARSVFEVGSGFGYSAFWFARALPPEGKVTLTEVSGELLERARTWLDHAGLLQRCTILPPGDGIAVLAASDDPLDLVFLDGRKEDYPRALSVALPRLRAGGLLVANSVLWGGAVARGETDAATAGLREYTRLIFGSEDLVSTLIPLRDGVALTYKR
jgi:caffeoyl-CoA O-methyltransferase